VVVPRLLLLATVTMLAILSIGVALRTYDSRHPFLEFFISEEIMVDSFSGKAVYVLGRVAGKP